MRNGPFKIALTGSIGMGKSTTSRMFADLGAAVWDADSTVHRLYAAGGAAVPLVGKLCPDAIIEGAVDRGILANWVGADPGNLKRLERVIHPLVAEDRATFLAGATTDIVVLDIPLLYETGTEALFDMVVVVSAPQDVQRQRVMARPGMTEAKLDLILSRQMPDEEKRRRADVVIDTSTLEAAEEAVKQLVARIRAEKTDA